MERGFYYKRKRKKEEKTPGRLLVTKQRERQHY